LCFAFLARRRRRREARTFFKFIEKIKILILLLMWELFQSTLSHQSLSWKDDDGDVMQQHH